jgi:hypothetical protein
MSDNTQESVIKNWSINVNMKTKAEKLLLVFVFTTPQFFVVPD